ncbi:MAG: hypothetical protein H0U74_12020 [Bradymonadaceae bacterium]|nr:hypothetical protein [Lujinxingiaceae bacterium]
MADAAWKTEAAAERLTFDELGAWQVDGLRIMRLPVALRSLNHEGAPVSGLLAPRVIYSDGVGEAEASYFLAPLRSALALNVAPGHWYGAGMLLVSERPCLVEGGACGFEALSAQLRYGDDVSYFAAGRAIIGDDHRHLSVSSEIVGDPAFWATERLAQRAFFRPWRLSRTGLSLSGDSHVLQASISHANRWRDVPYASEDDSFSGELRYGAAFGLGRAGELSLDLNHQGFDENDTIVQQTTAIGVWQRDIGSWRGALLRPQVFSRIRLGLRPQERGMAASTTAQAIASLQGSLAFSGRFAGAEHLVRPRLTVARELTRFDREASGGDAVPTAPASPWSPQAGWTMASAVLEQRLRFASGWIVELPAGVAVVGDSVSRAARGRPTLFARTRIESPGSRPFSLSTAAVCTQLCDELSLAGALEIAWSQSTTTRHVLARARGFQGALVWLDGPFALDWSALGRLQAPAYESLGVGFFHVSTLNTRWDRWTLSLSVPGRADRPLRHGVEAGFGYALPELGWQIGARGALLLDGDQGADWGAMVGLAL